MFGSLKKQVHRTYVVETMYSVTRKLLIVGLLFICSNALSILVDYTYVNHLSGSAHIHHNAIISDKQATLKAKRCHEAVSPPLCRCGNCNNCELFHCATTPTITSVMLIYQAITPSQTYNFDYFGIAAAHSQPPYKPPIV